MERSSGGSCQSTRLISTAESTRRSSGTTFLRIGLTQHTGLVTKTAYSIFKSWRKNYVKGERKRNKPTTRRLFARAKQTLIKLEGERLRLTIKPGEHVYIDLKGTFLCLRKFHQRVLANQ